MHHLLLHKCSMIDPVACNDCFQGLVLLRFQSVGKLHNVECRYGMTVYGPCDVLDSNVVFGLLVTWHLLAICKLVQKFA